MTSMSDVLESLNSLADPANVAGMARFGMSTRNRLGIPMPQLRLIAKQTGTDHVLAAKLWRTCIPEARILASLIGDPSKMSSREMDQWVLDLDSWDVCDQVCMNLFEKTRFARQRVFEWSTRKEEFVKRAAFALIACLAWHDKEMTNTMFLQFLKTIKRGATDDRNFVKKAVNWALRHIGKRNLELNKAAIATAQQILTLEAKAARWIATDALRELRSQAVQARLSR
jgi:3-methyladenine DNA glycosylase AlkD